MKGLFPSDIPLRVHLIILPSARLILRPVRLGVVLLLGCPVGLLQDIVPLALGWASQVPDFRKFLFQHDSGCDAGIDTIILIRMK